jgi:uncharacterized membrane protein YdbT with pleckstrin-like domain
MGYIDNNLITGESVTYRARLHWLIFLKPLAVSIAILAVASLVFYISSSGAAPDAASTLNWVGAGLLAVSAIPLVVAAVKRSSAEFAVTNKRVILKTGAIQNETAEMFLNKIESVGVDQSIAGRVFGYGTIVIRGTGGSLEPFHRIAAPLVFRKQIQEQIGKTFDPAARPTPNA